MDYCSAQVCSLVPSLAVIRHQLVEGVERVASRPESHPSLALQVTSSQMAGIQALAAAAATRKVAVPSGSTSLTTGTFVTASSGSGSAQGVQAAAVSASAASSPSASVAAVVSAPVPVSAPASGAMRIVQAQGSPTYRVSSPTGALGEIVLAVLKGLLNVACPVLTIAFDFLSVGPAVRLASSGATLLRSAAPGQPGKQIFLQRPGSNQPGQIVTLVKTSQGMTVASVNNIFLIASGA